MKHTLQGRCDECGKVGTLVLVGEVLGKHAWVCEKKDRPEWTNRVREAANKGVMLGVIRNEWDTCEGSWKVAQRYASMKQPVTYLTD